MDEGDHAQRREEIERETGIAIVRARLSADRFAAARHGAREFCKDCGETIPEERRRAVPGATRCILCQSNFERGMTLEGE